MDEDSCEWDLELGQSRQGKSRCQDDKVSHLFDAQSSIEDSGYHTNTSMTSSSLSFSDLLSERFSESSISSEGKRRHDLIRTPSKQDTGSNSPSSGGKSPLRSGSKNALQYLWASVSRLSPRMSPVEKKPNMGSRLTLASPKDEKTTGNVYQSTPNETVKPTRRVLFGQGSKSSICDSSSSVVAPKPSTLNRLCERTNALFKLPLAYSPQKKGHFSMINKMLDDSLNKPGGELVGLKKSNAGVEFIDFVTEFARRDMDCLLVQCLSNEDLFNCSLVCRRWNRCLMHELTLRKAQFQEVESSVEEAKKAKENMENFQPWRLSLWKAEKEIRRSTRSLTNGIERRDSLTSNSPLRPSSISNLMAESEASSDKCSDSSSALTPSIADKDMRESREDKIVKCPSCCARAIVAAVKDEGKCSNQMCQYHFCGLCDSPYHGARPCRELVFDDFLSPSKLRGSNRSLKSNDSGASGCATPELTEPTNLCKSKSNSSTLCSKKARANLRRL